jgi:hypothetical protein
MCDVSGRTLYLYLFNRVTTVLERKHAKARLEGCLSKCFFTRNTRFLLRTHVFDGFRASERFELEKDNVSDLIAGKQS